MGSSSGSSSGSETRMWGQGDAKKNGQSTCASGGAKPVEQSICADARKQKFQEKNAHTHNDVLFQWVAG